MITGINWYFERLHDKEVATIGVCDPLITADSIYFYNDDNPDKDVEGMSYWALNVSDKTVTDFAVSNTTLTLKDRLMILMLVDARYGSSLSTIGAGARVEHRYR